MHINRRESASGEFSSHESAGRTTIRRICDAVVNVWVFLVTWARNVKEELETSYFLYDLRSPSTQGMRPAKDKAFVTRPNPLLSVGGRYVYRVQVLLPRKQWALWLEDRTKFILNRESFLKPPVRDAFKTDEEWRRAVLFRDEMIDLMKALGYTQRIVGDKVSVDFGPILENGWDTGFTKQVYRMQGKKPGTVKTYRAYRAYRLAKRILSVARERGTLSDQVPVDPAYNAQMSRLARVEAKRADRNPNESGDLSPDYFAGGVVSKWEVYPPETCVTDLPVGFSGKEYGLGLVPPAYTCRIGLFDREPFVLDNGEFMKNEDGSLVMARLARVVKPVVDNGTVTFEKVPKTVPAGRWKTDWRVHDKSGRSLINAIRRELDGGKSPFIVQQYAGHCSYKLENGRVAGIQWEDFGQKLILGCRSGDIVELPMVCTTPSYPVDRAREAMMPREQKVSRCGSKTWEVHEAYLSCTKCGRQRWRQRIMAYVRIDSGRTISADEVGRFMAYDHSLSPHLHLSVPIYGAEVETVLRNLRKAGIKPPTKLVTFPALAGDGIKVRHTRTMLYIQRFWFDYTGKSPSPTKKPGKVPVWSPRLPEVQRGATSGSGASDTGWVSPAFPGEIPEDKLEGIKSVPPERYLSECVRVAHIRAKRTREAVEKTIRALKKEAEVRDEIETDELLGLVKIARTADGGVDLS